jgi:hypothetical protein
MSSSFAARIAARFAPLDFTNVFGFPNVVPDIKEWGDHLPSFREDKDDNPAQHLFEFHKLMHQLDIHHEDVLMKLFMFSLGGDARLWYKSLLPSNISSLKEFHAAFHKYCKRMYSSEFLFEDCCNLDFVEQDCKDNQFVDEKSEHDSNCGQLYEEEFAEKQDILQTDQENLYEEDFEVNQEEVSCSSKNEDDMIASKNEEILTDPPVLQADQRQDDESSADLDPCEGQWLIEDHKQSTLGKDDFGNDTDNGNDTLSAFVIVPNVHSNYCHDQTTVLNSYFDQAAIIQSSLLDHQEMEVFESQSS